MVNNNLVEIHNNVSIGNEQVNSVNDISITTLEIAELTGKRHDHVMRDTEKMLTELYGEVNLPKFGEIYKDTKNREYKMYRLPKKEALCLASKYGAKYYDILDTKLSENKPTIASNNNTIIPFSFENYNLDYGILNGEPVFNLNSIASYLGINNPRMSIDIDDTDYVVKINSIVSFTYNRKIHNTGELFLTEAGLYRLLLRSNKPQAEKFSKWVTKEVLPSIRKTGSYSIQPQFKLPQTYKEALLELVAEVEKNEQLTIENKELKESKSVLNNQVLYLMDINEDLKEVNSELSETLLMLHHTQDSYSATELAKELGFKSAIEFNIELHNRGIQYKSGKTWVLYSKYANKGYTVLKQEIINGSVRYYNRFTQLGREFILKEFKDNIIDEDLRNTVLEMIKNVKKDKRKNNQKV